MRAGSAAAAAPPSPAVRGVSPFARRDATPGVLNVVTIQVQGSVL
jgi:hypothetical protein